MTPRENLVAFLERERVARRRIESYLTTPAQRAALDKALGHVVNYAEWQPRKKRAVVSLSIAHVLSTASDATRLERARQFLRVESHRERRKVPAIDVVGFKIPGCGGTKETPFVLWRVKNGQHRTEVARESGKRIVTARISGVYVVDPARYKLLKKTLWVSDVGNRMQFLCEVVDDVAGALRAIGVGDVALREAEAS